MYEPRIYRHLIKDKDLVSFNACVKETDLYIRAVRELQKQSLKSIKKHRQNIETYIRNHPDFLTALEPVPVLGDASEIVKLMSFSAEKVSLGPMSAVAGAVAEFVGRDLLAYSPEVIVENGGDIFLKTAKRRLIGIYAGGSPLSGKVAIEIDPSETPLGICTSSGTVGHSLSFGRADAVVVLSPSTPMADAAATAIGNIIKTPEDIEEGIAFAQSVEGIQGLLIINGDRIGAWGEIQITRV